MPPMCSLLATVGSLVAGHGQFCWLSWSTAVAKVGRWLAFCKMKRLYVRPAFRSWGLGKHLIGETIQAARRAGYTVLRLDTLASMEAAQGLYRSLGFSEIPAYNSTHLPGTRFYELRLVV
jgi:ribosomal protein S18 acetylase RimI-like enzyme